MLSTLVDIVVWFVVSVECGLGASVVVSDTELVLLISCVVVVLVVTSDELVIDVSVDSREIVVVAVFETELVVSPDPCVVVVFWFVASVEIVLVASVDSEEVCVVSEIELYVLLGSCVVAVTVTASLVESVALCGVSVVIVSDVVAVSGVFIVVVVVV